MQEAAGVPLGLHGEHLGNVLEAMADGRRGYKSRIDAYIGL